MEGEPLKPFYSRVAGVTHRNDDGSDRQKILKNCRVGERLTPIHKPVPQDPNAVILVRENGEQLGWLTRELAQEIAPRLDKGSRVDIVISELSGGGFLSGKSRGCNIMITKYSMR